MAGSSAKRKGSRIELEIVRLHTSNGIAAEKMPLSGALGGKYAGDVLIDNVFRAEVKARSTGKGWATLEKWLGENDLLFLRQDYHEPLVLLPFKTYLLLMSERRELLQQPETPSA